MKPPEPPPPKFAATMVLALVEQANVVKPGATAGNQLAPESVEMISTPHFSRSTLRSARPTNCPIRFALRPISSASIFSLTATFRNGFR